MVLIFHVIKTHADIAVNLVGRKGSRTTKNNLSYKTIKKHTHTPHMAAFSECSEKKNPLAFPRIYGTLSNKSNRTSHQDH